jgi:hypothetical protein
VDFARSLDVISQKLDSIDAKIRPERDSLFRRLAEDWFSNLIWEFIGYHRDRGGILPFLSVVLGLALALLKVWLLLKGKNKNTRLYVTLDAAATAALLALPLAALWILTHPQVAAATPVDLAPLEERIAELQAATDRLGAQQTLLDPRELASAASAAATACDALRKSNDAALDSLAKQVDAVPSRVPGYMIHVAILLLAGAGALGTIWLFGSRNDWW